jgi:hypothetical protein
MRSPTPLRRVMTTVAGNVHSACPPLMHKPRDGCTERSFAVTTDLLADKAEEAYPDACDLSYLEER